VIAGCDNLGMRCGADGLFPAGAPLIERPAGRYQVRPAADLERLLRRAYDGNVGIERVELGLKRAASALNQTARRRWLYHPPPAIDERVTGRRYQHSGNSLRENTFQIGCNRGN
jgi:hypothetical protein